MKLAAIIICRNEERSIGRCLDSVRFCDEIIVVDSGSTDRTMDLAYTFTDRVYTRPWQGYAAQKDYALSLATADWILSIDADEVVTEALREEILRVLQTGPKHAAFSMPRKTLHFGRWIRHGGWYPNRVVRLFERSKGKWIDSEIHERWESVGSVGVLREHFLHHSFFDLADQVARNNHYSTLGALQLQRDGRRFSSLELLWKPLCKFLETYFIKLGLLDGYPGFVISVSAAYSVFLKWMKLWELEHCEAQH